MSNGELTLSRDKWREVQNKLKTLGFYFGEVDGKRGPLTDNAITAFKRSIGFKARPFFGPDTWQALMVPATASLDVGVDTKIPDLPWIANARKMLGLHERTNTQLLLDAFRGIVPDWVNPKEVSWCGAFVAVCFKQWRPDIEVPANILGARQWGNFGVKCEPQRGAVLTFWRGSKAGWQGHVGFMAGQDSTTYHVLGGNQSDAVTITRIAKTRLLQSRWPKDFPETHDVAYGSLNVTISENEA